MKNLYLNLKSKLFSNKNSFVLGLKKGLSIPTLPPKINQLYYNPLMRIFRVIGGICILLVLTNQFLIFSYKIIRFTILFIASIHAIFIVIIFIIKIVYSIYTLIVKSKEFEIRK